MFHVCRISAIIGLFAFSGSFCVYAVTWDEPIIIDHRCLEISLIPDNWIDSVRNKMAVFYTGGSHASQYGRGLELVAELLGPEKYKVVWHSNKDGQDDLPTEPGALRVLQYGGNYVGASKLETIFAEQGGVINAAGHGWCDEICKRDPGSYISAVEEAEQRFPDVAFWYATGIEDWDDKGVDSSLCRPRNDSIRSYCRENNKVLFDFLALDMTDDDGIFHDNPKERFGGCEWCKSYCSTNDCETNDLDKQKLGHTHVYSCFRKGKAMWWMLARMAGWPGPNSTSTENVSVPNRNLPNFNGSLSARDISSLVNTGGYSVKITDLRGREISPDRNPTGLLTITAYDRYGNSLKTAVSILR